MNKAYMSGSSKVSESKKAPELYRKQLKDGGVFRNDEYSQMDCTQNQFFSNWLSLARKHHPHLVVLCTRV